jgi:hypothetical protein
MRHFSAILLLVCISICKAQPKTEMTPQGFPAVELPTPNKPHEKLIELTKAWASYYNQDGYDVFDVTDNSATVGALKINACFHRSLGVLYDYNIRYTLKIVFSKEKTYTLKFSANEFYADDILTKTNIPDFFTTDGKIKEDFEEVKPSLERTANKIIESYSNFIAR